MDEVAFYVTKGDPEDKQSKESLGVASSVHKAHVYASFRNADCPLQGAALTGMGPGERLFVAGQGKALISSYSWGKEGVEQKFPVPEEMSCLSLAEHPNVYKDFRNYPFDKDTSFTKPKQHIPWLLAAGSKTGKLYIWELASGNLLCVKDAHYQGITCIRFSYNSTFCITGGEDARVTVWRTADLVSFDDRSPKPWATFSDHTLAITDISVTKTAIPGDVKIYTASKDSTVRSYNVLAKQALTTFVFSSPVECLAHDAAERAIYAGLSDGSIKSVPFYVVNKASNSLESVIGTGKVVTVPEDPDGRETFVYHQTSPGCHPTRISMSLDGSSIISGDTIGRVFVGDVVTKQVIKAFTPVKSAIAFLQVETHSDFLLKEKAKLDKKHRLLQPLKRVIFSGNPDEHVIQIELTGPVEDEDLDEDDFFLELEEEELELKRQFEMKAEIKASYEKRKDDSEKVKELQEKLDKVSGAYNSLKEMYEELYKETQQ